MPPEHELVPEMERVLEYYGRTVQLGSRFRPIICPFHDDHAKSAGACVSGFKCHTCGIKGDVYKVIMEVEKCDFPRAVEILEAITGGSYKRVSKPTVRKSWGVPPFGERDRPQDDRTLPTRVRKQPPLWG